MRLVLRFAALGPTFEGGGPFRIASSMAFLRATDAGFGATVARTAGTMPVASCLSLNAGGAGVRIPAGDLVAGEKSGAGIRLLLVVTF